VIGATLASRRAHWRDPLARNERKFSLRDMIQLTGKTLFTIFVDATFTALSERPFTNAAVVIGPVYAIGCVWRARHAD